uniref:Uncharacterized protein n=1 Tax=Romanomermis culicivorax TaxID=13658 RepID=A0A915HLZ0_ROMCU
MTATAKKGTIPVTETMKPVTAMTKIHSTHFYKRNYQNAFRCSLQKLTNYISPLHPKAEIQHCLEALKNAPPQMEFKVQSPSARPMDVEPTIPNSDGYDDYDIVSHQASMLVPPTTVTPTRAMTTSTAAITSTAPIEPHLVIATRSILGAVPPASTDLQFQPQLPRRQLLCQIIFVFTPLIRHI